ncbi:MAG: COP23 domain-containing protein [Cyanobacteria bacterium P01_A01_bin.17]
MGSLGVLVAIATLTPSTVIAQPVETELPPVDPGIEDIDPDSEEPIDSELPPVDSDAVNPDDIESDEAAEPDDSSETEAATESESTTATTPNDERFFCQSSGNQYSVMYNPESRPGEAFPWAIPQELGGGWTPELRCLEIAKRLEEYRPDGLQELQTSTENGYDTVCVTTESNGRCRLVFTVPPGQDPVQTRDSVFENLTTADSGQQTQGVTTFADGGQTSIGNLGSGDGTIDELVNLGVSILSGKGKRASSAGIPLKPYLDASDGGTGVALTDGVPVTRSTAPNQRGRRLQPNQFR